MKRVMLKVILFYLFISSATAQENAYLFSGSFNGGHSPDNPGSPTSWAPEDWDVQVHVRSAYEKPGQIQNHSAHHGSNCEAPGAQGLTTHQVNTIEGSVYQCSNHLMTSLRADDYGLISLTPPAMVDFSNGEAIIQFDISTLSVSQRDWFGVVIQPWDNQLPLAVADSLPDLNGFGRHAIHFDFNRGTICPVVYRDFVAAEGKDKFSGSCRWWDSWENYLSPSAQQRKTIKITISKQRVKVEVPEIGLVWDDMSIADLGWDTGVVSFLHHSYTPHKDGNGGPNTWHWDNVQITPTQNFTIMGANRRWVNQDNSVLRFSQPAPGNSFLRGSAIGTQLQVSFDKGATWETLQEQTGQKTDRPSWQFWHPVPVGTQDIQVRAGDPQPDWWNSAWIAKDISIFSASVESTPSEPEVTSQCALVTQVMRFENGEWVPIDSSRTEYSAADCIAEKPEAL